MHRNNLQLLFLYYTLQVNTVKIVATLRFPDKHSLCLHDKILSHCLIMMSQSLINMHGLINQSRIDVGAGYRTNRFHQSHTDYSHHN